MAGMYDLNSKAPRRCGMIRSNPYASLHGKCSTPSPAGAQTLTEEEINASPKSSTSSGSLIKLVDEDEDGASDDSLLGAVRTKRKNSSDTVTVRGVKAIPMEAEDDWDAPADGLEPSTIPTTSFIPSTGRASRYSSPNHQKRSRVTFEDNDKEQTAAWASQARKARKQYGSSSQRTNIHQNTSGKPQKKPIRNKDSPTPKKVGPQFRAPLTSQSGSTVNDRRTSPKNLAFKRPSSNGGTPRSRSRSRRSFESTQDMSPGTPRQSFKQPLKDSPRKSMPAKLKAPSQFKGGRSSVFESGDSSRKTRSSAPIQGPLDGKNGNSQGNLQTSSHIQKAANIAANKLRLPDFQLKQPSSHDLPLSEPSMSLSAADTLSTSPSVPKAYPAVESSQENGWVITSEDIVISPKLDQDSTCPFCKEIVNKDFLEEHINLKVRISIRQQAQFCKRHKKRAAEDEWKFLGFPTIDWRNMDERLKKFHPALDNIIRQRRGSFYRNAFEDLVKARKNKMVREDLLGGNRIEEISPGYYGSRGAKVMTENIISKFAGTMRRLAASDVLISSAGASEFVQAVLVPELAIFLIKDDRNIQDDEEARKVMRNSVDIGHLLNEEEDEIIQDPDTQETRPADLT